MWFHRPQKCKIILIIRLTPNSSIIGDSPKLSNYWFFLLFFNLLSIWFSLNIYANLKILHVIIAFTLHKKWSFLLRISPVNWPNPHFSADLITFTDEILNGKLHFSRSVGKQRKTQMFTFLKWKSYIEDSMLDFWNDI